MRRIVMTVALLVVTAAACGKGDPPAAAVAPPETSTGPGAAGLLACQALVRAIDAATACARNDDEQLIAEHLYAKQRVVVSSTAALDDADARQVQAQMCVDGLASAQKLLAGRKCAYTPTAQERAWIDAQVRRRTPVPAAAAGADRAILEEMARLRDRACACTSQPCVDEVIVALDAVPPTRDLPGPGMKEAAGAMFDELAGCSRRVTVDALLGEAVTDDPEAIRALAAQIRAMRAGAPMPPAP